MSLMYGQGGGTGDPITMPPTEYRLGGVRPLKMMLGTGTTAAEVWSIYPVSGGWGPSALGLQYATYGTYTVIEAGSYTITQTVTRNSGGVTSTYSRIAGSWGNTDTEGATVATASTTQTLAAGSTIIFQSAGTGNTSSGSWSIVKN